MSKVYQFIKKLLALALNTLAFIVITNFNIPWYFTAPVFLLVFSLISSRILGENPKELYNFQRSEKYFSKGGLRDLVRIPVVLFAFLHDVVVWGIWGIYQIFLLIVDLLFFIKELIYQIFHALIWIILQLVPFWRIVIKILFFYFIKWPWWIYKYAYKALIKTYNRNILKIAFRGSLLALLIIQFFFFLDISLGVGGLRYIGLILSLLPVSWIFAEVSSLRGQKLMYAPFNEVKLKFRNGLETVRGILFFLTFFVVLLLAQMGLNILGWIPRSGILLLGLSININLVINIIFIFLLILISFGTFVLPTYRLYNEFSETSLKNISQLLSYIGKRLMQIISGFIPATFFSVVGIIPSALIVYFALFTTLTFKNNIIQFKIDKLTREQQSEVNPVIEYQLTKQIEELKFTQQFPANLIQEMEHRPFLKTEIENKKQKILDNKTKLTKIETSIDSQLAHLDILINKEKLSSPAINETRIEELTDSVNHFKTELGNTEKRLTEEINRDIIDVEFAGQKFRQLPVIFYLSGLFMVLCSSFILVFFFGYFGNFFYAAFKYRNNNQPAEWKVFIKSENLLDSRQPLLSTTLNIIIGAVIIFLLAYSRIIAFFNINNVL